MDTSDRAQVQRNEFRATGPQERERLIATARAMRARVLAALLRGLFARLEVTAGSMHLLRRRPA